MLKLLFDLDFWYDMAMFAIVILLIILAIKVKGFRIFVLAVLYLAIVASAVFSYFKINEYYKAEGGVVGTIKSISEYNKVENNDLVFDFRNVVMTENGKVDSAGNVVGYSAKFTSDCVPKFVDGQVYQPYVNGSPVDVSEFSTDLLVANYEYNFYDEDQNLILNDTLKFRFAFYKQSTSFIVSTEGGAYACKQWNYFFNKNGFIVELKPVEEKDDVESFLSQFIKVDMTIQEGDTSQSLQTFYFKQSGMIPKDFKVDSYRYNITGWIDAETSESVDISTTTFTKDTRLQAVYEYNYYNITFTHLSGPYDETKDNTERYIGGSYIDIKTFSASNSNYNYVGLSIDNSTLLKENLLVTCDRTIDVIWKSKYDYNTVVEYFITGALDGKYYFFDGTTDVSIDGFSNFEISTTLVTFDTTFLEDNAYIFRSVRITPTEITDEAKKFLSEIKNYIESVDKTTLGGNTPFNFSYYKAKCMEYINHRWTIVKSNRPGSFPGSGTIS